MCGKLWAAGRACGAILRGVRDYSWPVNIDSGGSGAAAQPGNAIFRARQEERPGAESGALSPGGRGQGEDVSSVIAARGSQQQHGAGCWERGAPQQGAGCPHSPLCDTSVPDTSRSSVGGPVQPMLGGIGCALHSGPRISQPKVHRELHKEPKNHRKSYKCKVHGWVYFCGCHRMTPLGTPHQLVLPCSQGMLPCMLGLQHGWEAGATGNNCSHMPVQVKSVPPLPPQAPEVPEDHLGCIASCCAHHTSS